MYRSNRPLRNNRSGVVLIVELAVALTILLIGIAAGILLLGSSQDLAGRSAGDTQAAMFADSVMNGLRAASDEAARTNAWRQFWIDTIAGETTVTVPAYPMWANESSLVVRAGSTNALSIQAYWHRAREDSPSATHAVAGVRYALTVGPNPLEDIHGAAFAILKVWPGAAGSLRGTEAMTFYSEFLHEGARP